METPNQVDEAAAAVEAVADSGDSPPRKLLRPPAANSPPANCAICLGNYTNKSYTDICLHQFCFDCLLKWSKVKAECPLCKQPFKTIIHNIRSNEEYDEHYVTVQQQTAPERTMSGIMTMLPDLYLPSVPLPPPAPPRRRYRYSTTFTVATHDQLAIHQLLLSRPHTETVFMPSRRTGPSYYPNHQESTEFRRAVYRYGWWSTSLSDLTGRFRDCSPDSFRNNPDQRCRILPWLNRELNALFHNNTSRVLQVTDIIMNLVTEYHITSRTFTQVISRYLGEHTRHFVHELYNFVQSPFDLIGYDRNVQFTTEERYMRYHGGLRLMAQLYQPERSDDPDVLILESSSPPPRSPRIIPEVIEINSDSSSDSDVIIREPTPPVVVDLLDSDSEEEAVPADPPVEEPPAPATEEPRSPKMPPKIRLKLQKENRRDSDDSISSDFVPSASTSSSSSDSSSSVSSSSSSSETDRPSTSKKSVAKQRTRKSKAKSTKRKHRTSSSSSDSESSSSDSNDKRFRKKRCPEKRKTATTNKRLKGTATVKAEKQDGVKLEIKNDLDDENAGPSWRLRSVVVKNGNFNRLWHKDSQSESDSECSD